MLGRTVAVPYPGRCPRRREKNQGRMRSRKVWSRAKTVTLAVERRRAVFDSIGRTRSRRCSFTNGSDTREPVIWTLLLSWASNRIRLRPLAGA